MFSEEQGALFLPRDLPRSRWVVMAHRSARAMFGVQQEPVRIGGHVAEYSSEWEAERVARRMNRQVDKPQDVFYVAEQAR
jgi:hypothetical protein